MRREDVLELRPIDERLVEVRVLAGGVAEDVLDARGDELLGEVLAARAREDANGLGRDRRLPGACAIAVTDSRIEFAAAVVTPVATRRRTKSRREMPLVRSCATRFLMTFSLARLTASAPYGRRLISLRSSRLRQEVGHGVDLVLGPERAAADHPVEHALPRLAVLPQRAPHARLVALEALAREDFFAGRRRRRIACAGLAACAGVRGRAVNDTHRKSQNEGERSSADHAERLQQDEEFRHPCRLML